MRKFLLFHLLVWAVLSCAAYFSSFIAHIPIGIVFSAGFLTYEFLGWLTGATDPLATRFGGTQIPPLAWTVWNFFWILFAIAYVAFVIFMYKKGRKWPLFLAYHTIIIFVGLFCVTLVGNINFPFQL
jgi:hypothetical protein